MFWKFSLDKFEGHLQNFSIKQTKRHQQQAALAKISEANAMLCCQHSFNELWQQLGGVFDSKGVYIACSAVIISTTEDVHQRNSIFSRAPSRRTWE